MQNRLIAFLLPSGGRDRGIGTEALSPKFLEILGQIAMVEDPVSRWRPGKRDMRQGPTMLTMPAEGVHD